MKTHRLTRSLFGTTALVMAAFAAPPAPADNLQTPAEIAAAIQKSFADLKEANDRHLAQMQKGLDDAVTKAEIDKVNANITKLQDALDEANRKIGRATIGAGSSGADDALAQNAARFFTVAGQRRVRPADADLQAYRNYRAAFEELVRGGLMLENLPADMRASLSVGSDRDGGYLVPVEMATEMEKRIYDTSPMRQIARVITIGAGAWEAPYKASKGVSGGWVGERQARPATGTGTLGMQRIEAHEQYAYPEVTQSMLDDGAMNVESFIVDDTEEEMSRTENLAFVSGTGVMKPRGFLDYSSAATTTADAARAWGSLQYVPTGGAGAFPKVSGSLADDSGCLIDVISKLNATYRQGAVWTMNRQTEATVRKLRDANGRYLVGFGDLGDGTTGFNLHGFSIVNLEDMPDIAGDTYSIAFGNFRRGYFIIDRMGFRLLRDPFTNKPYVGFYISKRTGGDVRNFDAIKLLKFAAS